MSTINSVYDVFDLVYKAVKATGVTPYRYFKPETETGLCAAINWIPRSKTCVDAYNDWMIFLYVPKKSGIPDSPSIKANETAIRNAMLALQEQQGVVIPIEDREQATDNYDGNYTVTTIRIMLKNT